MVGGLVGFGVGVGAGNSASVVTGVLASVIALASVAGGKYWAVHAAVGKAAKIVEKQIQVTDDQAIRYLAKSLVSEYETQGRTLTWPAGKDKDNAREAADFPKDLWDDASKRWQGMGPGEQASYRANVEQYVKGFVEQKMGEKEQEEFLNTFSLFDILWAFLAIGTAFRLGSGGLEQSSGT